MLAHLLLTRIRSHLLKHQRPQQSGFTPVIFAKSLEVLVMALEALHEEAKPLGLEVSWLKNKVQKPAPRSTKMSSEAGVPSMMTNAAATLTSAVMKSVSPTAASSSSSQLSSPSPSTSSASAAGSEPSVNQKLFLVVSVALATVCFFTNVLQVAVFARPSAMRCVKGVLLLSQAVSGLVATFVVAFPIHVISSRGGE
ncbi:hypothetical protein GWK47_009257 [Chionoecetes opilio]|uniref:Uncharacterized protein n=1 Tax=Chionoecetes opilio TaxID=41210 RepID=A0A8J4XYP2_CHIOP|nr:hypothetical protein GWK47_009257 [Chionoecetes opilio]